jgi:acyl transferase domain-containing protein/phosphopantetheinyl transferase
MTSSDPKSEPVGAILSGDIAIVGMGCLFAGAPDLDSYWNNIISKVDAVSDPPANEWDPKIFYDPQANSNDRVYCKKGGYIGDLARFQPLDFGIMPVTVDGGEPDQWLALRVAHEALADAGYAEPPKEHERTEVILGKGTYINRGNLTVGYHGMIIEYFLQALRNLHPEYTQSEIGAIKKELKATLPAFSADTAPALIGNIIVGRVANRLDFMGPSFTVDAACASALVAIEVGVRDLLSHKCDLVLAGGVNVNAPLPTMSLFCQLGALSRQEKIRPFDTKADGTILGEGLGIIVLKRRSDAEREGNRIYAIIKGVGVASDGRAVHVMAPRLEGEELALRRAYEMAGVSPQSVGLIEAHGTATPVGDVVEIQALSRVFGARQGSLPSCALGSVKSMIGHAMPAAGIAGVIKAALALYHRVLPPTINCEEPNPALHLEKTSFYVNTETRPWIHSADTPRRAGVNSFGFGGINAHVVLEEHSPEKPDARSHQLHWESEVCIIEAESRNQLIERSGRLREYLAGETEAPLKDIAYSLNCPLEGQPSRLALIATSKDDLRQKLTLAMERLVDPKCRQIKDTSGIYFFDRPLEGKLAFLFPGEGAQYPNMLADLCLHFPEVRNCFDRADRALMHGSPKVLPSDLIFPRTILSPADRTHIDKALWQIDGAVEGVLIGNWAMWTLLSRLEIRPDIILGHSTGDYSAMLASKIIDVEDEAYVGTILSNARLSEKTTVPKAMVVAVAADSATVQSIVDAVGDGLYLAMDNCPHQSVLVGSKTVAERAVEHLRRREIIYEILPFDRPYHTPMFQAYAEEAAHEFFAHLSLSSPRIETWSCTTASRYPAKMEEIRKLFVAHWVRPVLFAETVANMYADGVRLFVEAGPRGNLTAFVSDILRGKPHLAMPANVPRRSGLTQINHLVGVLAAQNIGLRLDYLYTRRNPQRISWEGTKPSVPSRPKPINLNLALPPLKLSPRRRNPLSGEHVTIRSSSGNGSEIAADRTPRLSDRPLEMPLPRNEVSAAGSAGIATKPTPHQNGGVRIYPVQRLGTAVERVTRLDVNRAPASKGTSAIVMKEYLKGMESFLDVEAQVMRAFLDRARSAEKATATTASPSLRAFPLLGTISSLVPGQELVAIRQLSQENDVFLRDHALGGPVSVTDPELRPLVVLPLTMGMEVLAEAAVALMPGRPLVGMRDVQAHHWIRVDDTPVNLEISARRVPNSANEVSVRVRNLAGATTHKSSQAAIEGTIIFGDAYSTPPRLDAIPLNAERISHLASVELYDGRLMFHGPSFQAVVSVDRSGPDGVIGQLSTLSAGNFFRTNPNPHFVTDPIVLDAAGQLVGFWAAEYLERGFVVFPYHLDRLHIYGPNRPAGQRLTCRVILQLKGNEGMRSEIVIAGADGAVWMHLEGWYDRRFDPPQRFHRAWIAPHEAMISEPWHMPLAEIQDKQTFECCRLESPFEPGTGLWQDLWASLVLSRQERKVFRELRGPEHRQIEWLSGRTAAKDAMRSFIRRRHGLNLLSADIEIIQDEHGRPMAQGSWTQQLRPVPELSLSHSDGLAVALAGDAAGGRRFGIDVQSMCKLTPDFEPTVLTTEEQRLLNAVPQSIRAEWLLRLWCVKEATSKAVGRGLIGGPSNVRILNLNTQTGVVQATLQGELAAAVPEASGLELPSYTTREGDYVVATAIYQKRTS